LETRIECRRRHALTASSLRDGGGAGWQMCSCPAAAAATAAARVARGSKGPVSIPGCDSPGRQQCAGSGQCARRATATARGGGVERGGGRPSLSASSRSVRRRSCAGEGGSKPCSHAPLRRPHTHHAHAPPSSDPTHPPTWLSSSAIDPPTHPPG
jgi:hypothetical protein